MSDETKIISAPQWLKDRMEALKKLPPPTVEDVRRIWEAAAKFREKRDWENPYKNVSVIR